MFDGHLIYSMVIWYVLVCCTKKNLATLNRRRPDFLLAVLLPATDCQGQGCQMVNFQTKNRILGKFLMVVEWKILVYFMTI
jgi:hypothetical protein